MEIEKLKAAGFVETVYPGQDGVFLTKRMPIWSMPCSRKHIVDGEFVTKSDTAIIEVLPDAVFPGGGVQMIIEQCDYAEEAVSLVSDEGLALLRDAGVEC